MESPSSPPRLPGGSPSLSPPLLQSSVSLAVAHTCHLRVLLTCSFRSCRSEVEATPQVVAGPLDLGPRGMGASRHAWRRGQRCVRSDVRPPPVTLQGFVQHFGVQPEGLGMTLVAAT